MSRASKLAGLVDKSPIRREGTPAIPYTPCAINTRWKSWTPSRNAGTK